MFCSSKELYIFASNVYSLVKMTSYCLNLNLALNLSVAVVLLSMNTLIASFSLENNLLDCFLVYQLVHIYGFYSLKNILLQQLVSRNFLYVFMLTTTFHQYLLLFLHNFFIHFSVYINHIYVVCSTEVLGFFYFWISFHYILLTHYWQ